MAARAVRVAPHLRAPAMRGYSINGEWQPPLPLDDEAKAHQEPPAEEDR